jgi:P-type Cu2+ transporter
MQPQLSIVAASDAIPLADSSPTSSRAACVIDVLDMHCAACAVLIEDALKTTPGVTRARVHYATQRARLNYDPSQISVEQLLHRIEQLGYAADIDQRVNRDTIIRKQRHRYIWGFGLSAFCAMQVMMLTLPRFLAGAEMEVELAPLLDWSALFLVLPVIGWTAQPFYRGMLRELALRRPGMDCAITLGIVSAFVGSMWHLMAGTGALYFDSVTMFVTLLLGVRWLEWEQREHNRTLIREASRNTRHETAMRLDGKDRVGHMNGSQSASSMSPVAINDIAIDDRIWVRTGEAAPVDGMLESDVADCDESLLTGESASVRRVRGQAIVAGAINTGAAFVIRATAPVDASTEQRLMALADDSSKPESLLVADRVARYFMPALIVVATITFVALLPLGASTAAERAIAVLIISCPCALALAAPAAYASAFAGLLKRGIVARRTDALARLARADAFVVDKTGTLSVPHINGLTTLRGGVEESHALAVIVALERSANHPLAAALQSFDRLDDQLLDVSAVNWAQGLGVSGTIANTSYRFGRAEFVGINPAAKAIGNIANRLWLVDDQGIVGALEMSERPKAGARELVQVLQKRGTVEMLSGDHDGKTQTLADLLGINVAAGACTPEQKAERIKQLQSEGRTVVMIGDGVNDSIGFAGADVAIAVNTATDTARASADMICLSENPAAIAEAINYAERVGSVVQGNFVWAIGYNVIAVPFAIAGWVDPLVASIGMAASSAVVMMNVMRLRRGSKAVI